MKEPPKYDEAVKNIQHQKVSGLVGQDDVYCIYLKYWDTLSTYHTCPKIWKFSLKIMLYVW